MKNKVVSFIVIIAFALHGVSFAAGNKTYQVTGPVLEVNDSMIAVQKGKERWEIARTADTKVQGDLKVGDKVTVMYTMSASSIENKGTAQSTNKR
jgi:hypothetical protein